MLGLILLTADPIAIWTLVVAIATLAVGIAAAWATFHYGRKAPTQDDLARVEQNTAHLEEVRSGIASVDARMKRQEQADDLVSRARAASISVKGEADANQPLSICLTGTEPTIHFTRVDFRSEAGNVFGMSECIATGSVFEYVASLSPETLREWRNAGTGVTLVSTRQILRVWMRFDDQSRQVYRDMAVNITSGTRVAAPRSGFTYFRIHGDV